MDKFVKRGKRKASPDASTPKPASKNVNDDQDNDDENESTDVKLAKLSSVHPDLDQHLLLDFLLAHNGSVKATLESIKFSSRNHIRLDSKPSSKIKTVKAQTSLRSFALATPTPTTPSTESEQTSPQKKRPKLLSRKGATLHLYDPEDIAQHTPCTVIHNFLPEEEANDLLKELVEEARSFQKITFKLFDNVVSSPHTSGFYVGTDYELNEQRSQYVYNGAKIEDVRKLTPRLEKIKPLVQEAVNREIQERIRTVYGGKKLKYQSPDPWRPNAAFVNCYNGPEESVGWHSDQLTYLGPRAIIASLSLGVTREFRIRRILPLPQDSSPSSSASLDLDPNLSGQISLPLPHNTLLIMHADMQESWKHCVTPARSISPHPISGNIRINITYRDYKPEFHPRFTPRCKCDVPTVLRVVQKKNNENLGRYFWMCHAGNVPGKEGCSFFQWAEFDDDGRPMGNTTIDGIKARAAKEEETKK
ncbi:hypothetical protein V8F20_003613 [Naviculisporaceae sp. PSN 640]